MKMNPTGKRKKNDLISLKPPINRIKVAEVKDITPVGLLNANSMLFNEPFTTDFHDKSVFDFYSSTSKA
jgi:hypothetical protein